MGVRRFQKDTWILYCHIGIIRVQTFPHPGVDDYHIKAEYYPVYFWHLILRIIRTASLKFRTSDYATDCILSNTVWSVVHPFTRKPWDHGSSSVFQNCWRHVVIPWMFFQNLCFDYLIVQNDTEASAWWARVLPTGLFKFIHELNWFSRSFTFNHITIAVPMFFTGVSCWSSNRVLCCVFCSRSSFFWEWPGCPFRDDKRREGTH